MLWKMDFIVEGKNLEKCLAALTGIALNMENPKPVVNGAVRGSTVKQISADGSQIDRLIEKLTKEEGLKSGEFVRSSTIRRYMDDLTIPPGNYSSLITSMKKREFLTTTDNRGVLKVL